jgi:hypothetical protein
MQTHYKDQAQPPATAAQLAAAGVDPSDLYWSGTFRSWRFAGATCQRFPHQTTGAILAALQITPACEA